MSILVKEIMTKPVITISEDKSVKDAAKLLYKKRKGFLVVIRRGKPVGVLSDKDIIYKVVLQGRNPSKTKVKTIMTKHYVYATPNEDIRDVINKMLRNNIHRMPVIEKKKLVGVISLTDIVRTSPGMIELLEYREKMKREPIRIKEKYTSGICDVCGNYSDHLEYINGMWVCEDCKESMELD